jgi:hypothetical protein
MESSSCMDDDVTPPWKRPRADTTQQSEAKFQIDSTDVTWTWHDGAWWFAAPTDDRWSLLRSDGSVNTTADENNWRQKCEDDWRLTIRPSCSAAYVDTAADDANNDADDGTDKDAYGLVLHTDEEVVGVEYNAAYVDVPQGEHELAQDDHGLASIRQKWADQPEPHTSSGSRQTDFMLDALRTMRDADIMTGEDDVTHSTGDRAAKAEKRPRGTKHRAGD